MSVQPLLRSSNDIRVGQKWRPFNCFSIQGSGGSPMGPGPENRVGDQDIGSPGRPISSGLQVPGEPGYCRARTRPLGDLPAALVFFLQNVLQLHQQIWVILWVDSLALWKIMNEENAVLIPKNWGRQEISSGILYSELIFGAWWAALPPLHWVLLCLVSGS